MISGAIALTRTLLPPTSTTIDHIGDKHLGTDPG
jgi:hypothetical protein